MEISGISNDFLDNELEEKAIEICKDSDIVITCSDIEGCDFLSLGRNSTKQVILKFVVCMYVCMYFFIYSRLNK